MFCEELIVTNVNHFEKLVVPIIVVLCVIAAVGGIAITAKTLEELALIKAGLGESSYNWLLKKQQEKRNEEATSIFRR